MKAAKKLASADGGRRDKVFQHRKLPERFAQGHELAGIRETQRDAAGEALQIKNAAKLLSNFTAHDRLLHHVSDGGEAGFDGIPVNQRAKEP